MIVQLEFGIMKLFNVKPVKQHLITQKNHYSSINGVALYNEYISV